MLPRSALAHQPRTVVNRCTIHPLWPQRYALDVQGDSLLLIQIMLIKSYFERFLPSPRLVTSFNPRTTWWEGQIPRMASKLLERSRIQPTLLKVPIVRLTRHYDTLKSCPLAHRSWYIIVVLDLYRALTLRRDTSGSIHGNPRCLSQGGTWQLSDCSGRGAADIETTTTC